MEEYRSAATGKLLYRHRHSLLYGQTWQDENGDFIEWDSQPTIQPLQSFFEMFGGEQFCTVIDENYYS